MSKLDAMVKTNPSEVISQEDILIATDAECTFLGALTHNPANIALIETVVTVNDLISKRNRAWYKTIDLMVNKGLPIDPVLMAEELHRTYPELDCNWLTYIGEAMYNVPSAANVKHYANNVKRYSDNRKAAITASKINAVLKIESVPYAERCNAAEGLLRGMIDSVSNQGVMSIQTALTMSIEVLENPSDSIEFPYGFDKLDEMTMGAHRGDLIYVAGRPSMGKTAWIMGVAESFCAKAHSGLIMSMEMSAKQLADRSLTSIGRIDAQRFRKGQIFNDEWDRLTFALGRLNEFSLKIDESSVVTPEHVRRSARRVLSKKGKLDFIMIDYLQLMTTGKKSGNRVDEITEISRELKQIAKEFNVPVIVLSQLNRNLEQRPNKRPVMSDLRESGAIEQDADLIIFLYRDEVYNSDSQDKGIAEQIVGKQRNGPIGMVKCVFLGAYSRFENIAMDINF